MFFRHNGDANGKKVLHEYQTDEKKSPLEARPVWKNSSVLLKQFISGNEI